MYIQIGINKIIEKPLIYQIFISGILAFAVTLMFLYLTYLVDANLLDKLGYSEETELPPSLEFFINAVVVAPIIETLIFQTGILLVIKKTTNLFVKNNWLFAFIGVTILFSVAHAFQGNTFFQYFFLSISRLPLSICLAAMAIYQRIKNNGKPFLAVWGIHAFYNFLLFSVDIFISTFFTDTSFI